MPSIAELSKLSRLVAYNLQIRTEATNVFKKFGRLCYFPPEFSFRQTNFQLSMKRKMMRFRISKRNNALQS